MAWANRAVEIGLVCERDYWWSLLKASGIASTSNYNASSAAERF